MASRADATVADTLGMNIVVQPELKSPRVESEVSMEELFLAGTLSGF